MSSECIKGEKLALILSVTGVFHFSLNKYISSQKTNLCSHIDAIYDFSNVKIQWAACEKIRNLFIQGEHGIFLITLFSASAHLSFKQSLSLETCPVVSI